MLPQWYTLWYSDACPGHQVTRTVSWEHHALLGSVGGGAWVPGSIEENFWRPLSTTRTFFGHVRISHTRKRRGAGEKAQHVHGQADDKLCRETSRHTGCKQDASVWGGKTEDGATRVSRYSSPLQGIKHKAGSTNEQLWNNKECYQGF